MPQALCYTGGYLVRDHQLIQEDLWVKKGKIVPPQRHVDQVIQMEGKIIAPGYIDIQINGGFGVDFATSEDTLEVFSKKLRAHGVLNYLPTLISSPIEKYPQWRAYYSREPYVLGIHLEGPFLNREKAGAHSKKLIAPITEGAVVQALEKARIVTLSPEIHNGLSLIKQLAAKGVVVAAGHTLASYEEANSAFEAGVKLVTHLFNAMTPIHHRKPGLAIATLNHPSVFYSLIADGVHVHPGMVKFAWQMNKRVILITDAMAAMGLEDGLYRLGLEAVEVRKGHAYIAGTKKLAGSVLQMDQAVRNFKEMTGCSLVEAIEAASLRPAELLGISKQKGSLAIGADADLIFLDHELNVLGHSVGG